MDLGRDPDGGAATDPWEVAICASSVCRGLKQMQGVDHQLSATKKGRFLEKSSGIALRISPSSSGVTSCRPRSRAQSSTRLATTPRTNDGMRSSRDRAAADHVRAGVNSCPYETSCCGSITAVPAGSYTQDGSAARTSPSSANARARQPPHSFWYSQLPHLPPSFPSRSCRNSGELRQISPKLCARRSPATSGRYGQGVSLPSGVMRQYCVPHGQRVW